MKRIVATIVVAIMLAFVSAQATSAQMGLSSADRDFMFEAARGGVAEIELGRLATQNAASEAVRQFGQRMMFDHGAANQELMLLAQRKGVMLPPDLGPGHRATIDRLAALSGADFDRAYMAEMMLDHQQDVALFEQAVAQGQDPEVRAWASKTLATVRAHHRMAGDIHARIAPAPVAVIPMPAASPVTTVTTITTTTTVVPFPPHCGGAYRPGVGTSFGTC